MKDKCRDTQTILVFSLRLSLNLVKLNTRIVWVSLRLSLNLVKLNTRVVWALLRWSLTLVKLKYQDSVGISTLVPHSSQTYQDSVGISTLVPRRDTHTILVFKFD
jgi:hypothetical protein